MKKSIFICMLVLFNGLLFSCSEKNDSDDEIYNKIETKATGGENNETDPDDERNKPKT